MSVALAKAYIRALHLIAKRYNTDFGLFDDAPSDPTFGDPISVANLIGAFSMDDPDADEPAMNILFYCPGDSLFAQGHALRFPSREKVWRHHLPKTKLTLDAFTDLKILRKIVGTLVQESKSVKDADFVDRSRIASLFNLQGIQAELDALNDLSENISTVTDAFQLHFKTAGAIDPTVKTQFEALKKSRSGLDKAKAIRQNVQELAQLYPQDKTAQRALADAETMVKRYVNHVNDCRNMIMTLSKKQMPASLKKMAKAVEDGIKARLVDPSVLDVTPWQDSFEDFNSSTSQRGACFQVDFRVTITRNDGTNYTVEISLAESTVRLTGPFIKGDYQYKPTTAKAVIEAFLEKLKGYPGLKGESDKNAARAPIAAAVKAAVRKVCARLASYGVDDVTVSNDNRFIEGAYQSDLPKYGPEGFDEWLYDDMVKRVFKETDDAIKRELTPYMGSIKKSNISVEEKGWIYIRVELN